MSSSDHRDLLHPHLIEFREKVTYDGIIIIVKNKIIKIKNKSLLTVDLKYDANNKFFFDGNGNVYHYHHLFC